MKRLFSLSFIIIGAIIGAGFASGAEILSFFNYPFYIVVPLFVLCGLFFYLVFKLYVGLGKHFKIDNISSLNKKMFGKFYLIADFVIFIGTFVVLAAMFAGVESSSKPIYSLLNLNINFPLASSIVAIITAIVLQKGIKGLEKTANLLIPIIVVSIIVISVLGLVLGKNTTYFVAGSGLNSKGLIAGVIVSFGYVCFNCYENATIIAEGSKIKGKKGVNIALLITGIILALLLFLIFTSLKRASGVVQNTDMPFLSLAFSINNFLGYFYVVVLLLSIFTSILTNSVICNEWLNEFIPNKFVSGVILTICAFVFSLFGFKTFVDVFYPIRAVLGAIYVIISALYLLKLNKGAKQEKIKNVAKLPQKQKIKC